MFYRAHLKLAVKFKTTSIWMENRLVLLGSELPSTPFSPISLYPLKLLLLLLLLHVLWLALHPLFPLCTPTLCKDCHHMFQRAILQHVWLQGLWLRYMLGLSGLSNLGNSHCSVLYLYINMAQGPHRLRISAFCLFTSSIHPPQPIVIQLFLSLYTFSPETSALPLSTVLSCTIEKLQTRSKCFSFSSIDPPIKLYMLVCWQ